MGSQTERQHENSDPFQAMTPVHAIDLAQNYYIHRGSIDYQNQYQKNILNVERALVAFKWSLTVSTIFLNIIVFKALFLNSEEELILEEECKINAA